jgi:hypothetical protein
MAAGLPGAIVGGLGGGALGAMAAHRQSDEQYSAEQIAQGFVRRLQRVGARVAEHPLDILNPFDMVESLSPAGESAPGVPKEMGKEDRIYIGKDNTGRAMYARNAFGKLGEEFIGWLTKPLEMIRRKQSTFVRPVREAIEGRDNWGTDLYDKDDHSMTGGIKAMGQLVGHWLAAQVPDLALGGLYHAVTGAPHGDIEAAKFLAPLLTGTTISQGHPLGPVLGGIKQLEQKQEMRLRREYGAIHDLVERGEDDQARQRLADIGIQPGPAQRIITGIKNPQRGARAVMRRATPEMRSLYAPPPDG